MGLGTVSRNDIDIGDRIFQNDGLPLLFILHNSCVSGKLY